MGGIIKLFAVLEHVLDAVVVINEIEAHQHFQVWASPEPWKQFRQTVINNYLIVFLFNPSLALHSFGIEQLVSNNELLSIKTSDRVDASEGALINMPVVSSKSFSIWVVDRYFELEVSQMNVEGHQLAI